MKKYLFVIIMACCIGLIGYNNSYASSKQNDTIESKEGLKSKIIRCGIKLVNLYNETIMVEETITVPETIAEKENTDFRNVCWGDSLETVKKYETSKTLLSSGNNADSLIYEDTLLGYSTYIIYSFENDKLYEASYGLKEEYTNSGQYIPQYQAIKNSLKEIYGKPIEDVIIPLEKQSLIDIAGDSTALRYGYVVYRAKWETETTNIMIGMQAQNYEVGTVIQYLDKNYKEDLNNSGL